MKLTFEIPDSITEKKAFSKSKLERDVHAILYLKLYQEGFIPDRDIGNILSSYKLEISKKKNEAKTPKPQNFEMNYQIDIDTIHPEVLPPKEAY